MFSIYFYFENEWMTHGKKDDIAKFDRLAENKYVWSITIFGDSCILVESSDFGVVF